MKWRWSLWCYLTSAYYVVCNISIFNSIILITLIFFTLSLYYLIFNRDSLGGNCKTIMIATINPEGNQTEESLSTCRLLLMLLLLCLPILLSLSFVVLLFIVEVIIITTIILVMLSFFLNCCQYLFVCYNDIVCF